MILSVEPRSVRRRVAREGKMDGDSVTAPSSVSRVTQKEYLTQSVTKMSESRYKITDTIYRQKKTASILEI